MHKEYIATWQADWIIQSEAYEIKHNVKCDCGETYSLVFPKEELIVCSACADFYNDKCIK